MPRVAKLEYLKLLEERAKRQAERSLRSFIRQAWHVSEPASPYVHGWHIDAIADHLEAVTRGDIRNLVINIPPRHGKSLIVSVFWPTWEWISSPSERWLFASYASQLSIRDNLKARRLIESPWFQDRWSSNFTLTSDQNLKQRFENNKTGYRIATSTGGAITGEGGSRVIADDPQNVQDADSDQIRAQTLLWWDEAMSTRLNDPKTGAKIIIMQRVHERDLSGHVLEQGGYEHLCLPAEYESRRKMVIVTKPATADEPATVETVETTEKPVTSIGWSDPRTEEGELLWPERFDRASLNTLKASMGTYAASGQLQQAPVPRGGSMVQRSWFRFYTELPDGLEDWLISLDCTFKETTDSDYVCGGVWARKGASKYLIYRIKERLDFPATLTAIRTLSAAYPRAQRKLVEDKANGPAVIASLRNEIPGIAAVEPRGSKVARLAAVTPTIEAGNVFLPAKASWVEDYLAELCSFPKSAHDDQVDMTSQALDRYQTGVKVRVW